MKRIRLKFKPAIYMLVCLTMLQGCSINFQEDQNITHAELVTDENRALIGKEVVEDNQTGGANVQGNDIPDNSVVEAADDDVLVPAAIDVFEVNNTIPEVIIPNGCCVVFVPEENQSGWELENGEKIEYNFEKYVSEVTEKQGIIVGIIQNGVMKSGDLYTELSGKYEKFVDADGEYAIYVINASSDYVTLKVGQINEG